MVAVGLDVMGERPSDGSVWFVIALAVGANLLLVYFVFFSRG